MLYRVLTNKASDYSNKYVSHGKGAYTLLIKLAALTR